MTPLIRRKLLQFSLSKCELTKDELIMHVSDEVKKIPLYKEKAVANKVFGTTAIMRGQRRSSRTLFSFSIKLSEV